MPPSRRRHYRVTEADVHRAHEAALRTGGRPGILNIDGVLSAIGRPYHGYHRSVHEKAAALVEGVATCHGFADGNKRTALIVTLLMLEESGYRLIPAKADEDLDDALEELILGVVAHKYTFVEMVAWFRSRVHRHAG
ncbi:MAG: type II toxin-antitoxin system death-on-curing family toxin [Hyphomicrobiaceae bacterium]|nr:type II toxin-antitoxin system death-on-curing family toxin [Hyphomicrobiaceae bacterium]